jgi:hypothetical protein
MSDPRTLTIGKHGRKSFALPVEAVTQKQAFLGRTGSGKSYAAMKVAEEMHAAGGQIVVIDVVGVWWGLRLAADGVSPGLDIPVIGGLRGDLPLLPTSGAMVADLVVDRNLSVVIDASQFESDKAKARFAADFADRFFWRKKAAPSPVHIFLEECQELVPQNIQRGEERMLHAWTRLAKLGRNFGIGVSLISQRPQEVNKKALNMTECLFAFQMTGTHERKAIRDWLGAKGSEQDITEVLRRLPVGTAHVSSPQWLQFEDLVAISERRTYDSSSTPSFEDTRSAEPQGLSHLDLDELKAAMAESVAEAEANDPKALKRRVAELEAELRHAAAPRELTEDEAYAEVEERDRYVMAALKEQRARIREELLPLFAAVRALTPFRERLDEALAEREELEGALLDDDEDVDLIDAGDSVPAPVRRPATAPPASRVAPARPRTSTPAPDGLGGPHVRILGAVAWLEAVGVTPAQNVAVAFLAGYRPSGGAFNNPKGALRTMGLLDYPSPGLIELTDEGRAVAEPPQVPRQLTAFHAMVLAKLPGPEQRILRPLLDCYPNAMDVQDLAAASGYSQNGGAFNNPKGRLRTLGLIDYPRQGWAVARDVLFPRGLR